jgi:methionyl aminopeptidase
VGHGVGKKVHEDPEIPNWGRRGTGSKLVEGMVIAIEPMVTEGDYKLYLADDGWTWKTKDGKRAAHFEHSMVVTKNGVEILTEL